MAEANRRKGDPEAGEDVPGRIRPDVWDQQARLAGVGAGRPTARFSRARLPDGYRKGASCGTQGIGKRIKRNAASPLNACLIDATILPPYTRIGHAPPASST